MVAIQKITLDTPLQEGTQTHFKDTYEMYQYFHDVYGINQVSEERPDDIVEYKGKKVSRYVRSIMEDDEEIGPFTPDEAISYIEGKL